MANISYLRSLVTKGGMFKIRWYSQKSPVSQNSETISWTQTSPVFKTTQLVDRFSWIKCKPEPYLHTVVLGNLPYDIEKQKYMNWGSSAYLITFIWDTRNVVDIQELNEKQSFELATLLREDSTGKTPELYAIDNKKALPVEYIFDLMAKRK